MYINKARLRVLQCQEELLDRLLEEASERLVAISKNTESYGVLLKNLILQVTDATYNLLLLTEGI
jgi:vacuolar-type H+-ATPase subunit E/Vma4